MPLPLEVDLNRETNRSMDRQRPKRSCCCCDFDVKKHCNRYWQAYSVVCFWCFILGLLILFNDQIVDPVINFLENLGVQKDNWMHVILYCAATPLIFAPHPVVIVSSYYVCMGFFFGWYSFLYAFLTLIWAIIQTWIMARYCCCDKRMIQRWFPKYADEAEAFSAAFTSNPIKLGFLISFAPFQSQYNLLFPPALSDMTFKQWFLPVLAGQMTVETFDLLIGVQAKTLADAIDPKSQSTEDLIIKMFGFTMLFIALTTLLWYFTRLLRTYTSEVRQSHVVRDTQMERHLANINVSSLEDLSPYERVVVSGRQVSGFHAGHVEGKALRIKL